MMNLLPSPWRLTGLWILLVALTVASLEYFQGLALGTDHRLGAVAVMIVAFVKVRLVGLDYMELRNAPTLLRVAFEAWVVICCLVITGVYWLSGT